MSDQPNKERGPQFCWHCNKMLQLKKGGGRYFALVADPLGLQHRVHIGCVKQVLGDGVREVK